MDTYLVFLDNPLIVKLILSVPKSEFAQGFILLIVKVTGNQIPATVCLLLIK